eukprot:8265463-Alexandrium_andersonii.AAC.1
MASAWRPRDTGRTPTRPCGSGMSSLRASRPRAGGLCCDVPPSRSSLLRSARACCVHRSISAK